MNTRSILIVALVAQAICHVPFAHPGVMQPAEQASGAQDFSTGYDQFISVENEKTNNNEIVSATGVPRQLGLSALTREAQQDPDLFSQGEEPKNIYLNFENAELQSFINYIADVKGMNIIPDKGIAGSKISLNFRNPVSKTGAWNALLSVTELAGFALIKMGNLYKIVPKDKKFRQPLKTFVGVKSNALPDSDATIRYIALLDNLAAQDVKPLLQTMLGQPSNIIDPPNINGFIITDCASTIKAAMQVVESLDQTGVEETAMVMTLKRVNAQDVKDLFDKLIDNKSETNALAKFLGKPDESHEYFAKGTRLFVDMRTNKLILLGQRQSLEKIKSFIVDHIDTELKQARSPLRIYELQNTNVQDIVGILKEVTDNSSSSAVTQQASQYGAVRDGVKYFKKMNFQADKAGNRLLVSCTDDRDWELLQETIRKLDSPQPQVAIQMLIVTVSASDVNMLGGSMRNPTSGLLGGNIGFQTAPMAQTVFETDGSSGLPKSLLGNLLQSLVASRGSAILSFGSSSPNNIWSVLQALQRNTDATVLSQPFATTTNCQPTKILVGDSTYVQSQTVIGGSSTIGGTSKADANTTITFVPQINTDGIISLKITADLTDFVAGTGGLSTQSKFLDTTVTVANGQVLAIGGFIKTKVSDSGGQTPGWGSIPILGWLAKNLNREITKDYLFMFICPTILKSRTSPGIGMYSKIALHQAAKEVEGIIETKKTNDPIYNAFFNSTGENYSHKVIDFANARYQPNNVDIRFDPYYRSKHASGTIKQQPLHIADEEFSPTEYWRQRSERRERHLPEDAKFAKPEAYQEAGVAQASAQTPQKPKKKKQEKESVIIPATRAIEPEKVTLPPVIAPVETENEPEEASPRASSPSAPATDLETSLTQKRSHLRALLSKKSLGTLLTEESGAPENREGPAEEIIQEPAQTPTFTLSKRRGIHSLLATKDESQPAPAPSNRRASSGLQSMLGGSVS